METVLLQINNEKGISKLKNLEAMKIVKKLKKVIRKFNLSDKFAGSLKLSENDYNEFQELLTESRNEWSRNT